MSHQSENCRSVCACVICTPFGAPVVPDVNSTSETSSPCTAPMRASTAASSTASPSREERAERVVDVRDVVETDDEVEVREARAKVGQRRGVVHAEELPHRERRRARHCGRGRGAPRSP